MIFWLHFETTTYTKDNFCFHESIFQWQIKHISHQSEFWHLRRKSAIIFQKWLFFSKFFGNYQYIIMLNALYKCYKVFTYKFYRHTICRGTRGTRGLWSFRLGALGSMLHIMWTWNSNSWKIHTVGPSLYRVSTFLALFWPIHKLEPDAQNFWLINGHFPTISSQFFAKYMNIFHKTEVQTIILRCWTGFNPIRCGLF